MPALWSQSGESAQGTMLVLLLRAGGARTVSEHKQICQARRRQRQRGGASTFGADWGPAGIAGKGRRLGAARPPAAGFVASSRCSDGRRKFHAAAQAGG